MENKNAKYLKYAIGEIILVVIGILIALQINNWNENRKLNKEEALALENLKQDFVYNKKVLLGVIAETDESIKACILTLNYTGSKPRPARERFFDSLMNQFMTSPYFYPRNGFLDDLINSGKLSLFKNVELRNRLSSWKPFVERVQERYTGLRTYQDDLNKYILEHGSWLNSDAISNEQRSTTFPQSGFEIDNRNMLGNLKFENMIENNAIYLDNYRAELINARNLLEKILGVIENEIQVQQ